MIEILMGIAQYGGAVAVLVAGIFYFYKKENKYVVQIEALNKELRENERETLEIISKLTVTLDKLVENDSATKTEIVNEIKNLREIIVTKIDAIKK